MTLPSASSDPVVVERDMYGRPRRELDGDRVNRRLVACADLAFVHDGCALIVAERGDTMIRETGEKFDVPKPGRPFDPIQVCEDYCEWLVELGCGVLVADVHYLETLRQSTNRHGIQLVNAPVGDARTRTFLQLRDYTRRETIRFSQRVADQLKTLVLVAAPGGAVQIKAPRAPGAGHADLAFALLGVVAHSARIHGTLGLTPSQVTTHRGAWSTP